MNVVKLLYHKIKTKVEDDRKAEHYECPNCHWDTTSDDWFENAVTSDMHFLYEGGWSCTAHWTCPVCGCKFDTIESN